MEEELIQVPIRGKNSHRRVIVDAADRAVLLGKKWYINPQGYVHDGRNLLKDAVIAYRNKLKEIRG